MTNMTRMTIQHRINTAIADVKRRTFPIDNLIPLMNDAKHRIDELERLLSEFVALCALGDLDEKSDDGIGWGVLIKDTKRKLDGG
jgi:hypothetical protein